MRKLKLDLGALRVETFEPRDGGAADIGTVRANSGEPIDPSGGESCVETACLTCLCPYTTPRPSCDDCSWDGCPTFPPQC